MMGKEFRLKPGPKLQTRYRLGLVNQKPMIVHEFSDFEVHATAILVWSQIHLQLHHEGIRKNIFRMLENIEFRAFRVDL